MSPRTFNGKLQDILIRHKFAQTIRTDQAIEEIKQLFAEAA